MYVLANHDWLIAAFLDGLSARSQSRITVADAVAFATENPRTTRGWQAARLRAIRGLAAHVHASDPAAAELIPAGLIASKTPRRIPYLYSEQQIAELMSRSLALSPTLLAASMHTLIGLLASTGMRSGEAGALDIENLDAERQVLIVTGKSHRTRRVALHRTTVQALAEYQQVRAAVAPPTTGPLLIGPKGARLNMTSARAAFRALVNDCQLPVGPGCRAPRLHDLRHTFAVNTLIDAHTQGADVDARVAALANYLGHQDPAHTYWYLTASPQLMQTVRERLAAHKEHAR